MKRLVIALVYLVPMVPTISLAAESAWVSPPAVVEVAVTAEVAPPTAADPLLPKATDAVVTTSGRGDVTIVKGTQTVRVARRDKRAMGLTILETRRTLREMRREGVEGDAETMAYGVLDRLVEKHPEAWETCAVANGVVSTLVDGVPRIDFSGWLAFLEAFIPLLLQLLALFGI